ELLHSLTDHTGSVLSVAYRPDGAQLASAGDNRTVRVWDAATGELLHSLTDHTGSVLSVAYRPDGAQLASAGDDRTVRVWDAATGEPAGWRAEHLPAGELAIRDPTTDDLLGASPGAWYWLGWTTTIDGNLTPPPGRTLRPVASLAGCRPAARKLTPGTAEPRPWLPPPDPG